MSSIFSYNLSRPYPFKWFTPVVFTSGVIAIVLFSLLNFVSNGYFLSVEAVTNPNATVSQGVWFNHWPSFITAKVQPTCQSADISVNSKFFTNQTGLTYTLTSVWQRAENVKQNNISSSLTYHNNRIQDCVTNAIEVDLEAQDRLAAQIAWAEWGAHLRAYATCAVTGASGYTMFNLTAEYDYVPEDVSFDDSTLFSFISRDKDVRASLWWGESLLSMYWAYLTRTMQDIRVNETVAGNAGIRKGTIYFTPHNVTRSGSINANYFKPSNNSSTDITNLDYFNVDYRFLIDKTLGNFGILFPGDNDFPTTISNLDFHETYPNIWVSADSLAKSFYSTIMTDLGQVSSTSSNILTNATTLQYFTSNFSLILRHIANAQPGPAIQDFNTLKSQTGPLNVTPSVIFSKYLCQIPKQKSAGNIFIAVLIADLVFLQALWQLLTFCTETFLLKRKRMGPEVGYCEGCLVQEKVRGHAYTDSVSSGLHYIDDDRRREDR
jgi:hypothetical protein